MRPETIEEFDLKKYEKMMSDHKELHKYNMVDYNKLMAGRYREQQFIKQSFMTSVLNKRDRKNLDVIKECRQIDTEWKRTQIMAKSQRWNEFRLHRDEVFQKYFKRKRIQRIAEGWYQLVLVFRAIMKARQNL